MEKQALLYLPEAFSDKAAQQTQGYDQDLVELDQAARKQRMAEVLINSDFHDEAVAPLREALRLTINSFAWLAGAADNSANEAISPHFIKNHLIDQHGLPEKTFSLFAQLEEKEDGAQSNNIKTLFADHQEVFQHVDEALNKAALL